ncbi:hypothetical protein ACFQXB_09715 [Plastorhodobacter daqingensis]|uniref:Uncharacterized protein n=1 Tax=Plastorhodobacter daqingensis TaxID=1387281 RepID=A0ABW2ULT0_9RHOB
MTDPGCDDISPVAAARMRRNHQPGAFGLPVRACHGGGELR